MLHVYAMQVAAVFTVSTATIGLRTGLVPHWLGVTGYLFAAVLFLATDLSRAVELLFPLWILLSTIDTLVRRVPSAASAIGAAHPTIPDVQGGLR